MSDNRGSELRKPADQAQRDRIVTDLDSNILVEAAAGTGKTTMMVQRMIALLRSGACTTSTLAAVTFTRKAAAELKSRFQAGLEKAAANHENDGSDGEGTRLREELSTVDQAFIGTIHSFCARLLRERPIEAGVDPGFSEVDDDTDKRYRLEAWQRYLVQEGPDSPLLGLIRDTGLNPEDLAEAFSFFCGYLDVDQWPVAEKEIPDLSAARTALESYVKRLETVLPQLSADHGNDKIIPLYRRLYRTCRRTSLNDPASLFRVLELVRPGIKIVHKMWPGGKEQAVYEQEKLDQLATAYAVPAVRSYKEYRYTLIIRAFTEAAALYDLIRHESGGLNFQDLLGKAAGLLRHGPQLRRYFKKRFTHLLVDEFQDTDPVQAEVMMLLTAEEEEENDWQRCTPEPGSLFVVGDPKQSIYRFRRADIVVYEAVKRIVCDEGNPPVYLTTSFRSSPALVSWVNSVFSEPFSQLTSPYSPGYVPLKAWGKDTKADLAGVQTLNNGKDLTRKELIHDNESELIAGDTARSIAGEMTVPGSSAGTTPCRAGDFMVVAAFTHNMGVYGERFQEHQVPHQVTGGSGLSTPPQLRLLADCLEAVLVPEDPVALAAVLRGGLFGVSDEHLYRHAVVGGTFNYRRDLPAGLDKETAGRLEPIFNRLREFSGLFAVMPPLAALHIMVQELGLLANAAAGPTGNLSAGAVLKALELLRSDYRDRWSPLDMLDYLRLLAGGEEKHDAVPASPHQEEPARVMNLHKVKGLEAPVVYLADPTGHKDRDASIHIDRSGGETAGYMKVEGPAGLFGHRPELAISPQWEQHQAEERKFAEAEKLRLLYVAATRAGSRLVISRRESRKGDSFWSFFDNVTEGMPLLEGPEERNSLSTQPLAGEKEEPVNQSPISASEIDETINTIADSWSASLAPSYQKALPSALVDQGATVTDGAPDEDAANRGTIIHALLEVAMADPDLDLTTLARSLLTNLEMPLELAGEYTATVQAIVSSDKLWPRARGARQLLTEVPYTRTAGDGPLTLIEPGTIDLAFEEDDGWVIVDYKTGAKAPERYKPQLEAYREAWEAMGCGEVKEVGLYFVDHDEYVVLDAVSSV